ncbi:hypothetical protein ACP26L_36270 (plasmid) [Paenibacillus sp. S-38]|uniref:hypothetical protein n=1 Tax=Paenibacillus sp. S-38 TaxID=3416710 RepID=UPI003CE82305
MDVSALLAGAGAIATAIFSYMVTKSNNKKDLTVSDRQQLSQEQKEIREELRSEIKILREEMKVWRDRSLQVEDELRSWKERYTHLEMDYMKATARIVELEKRLDQKKEA